MKKHILAALVGLLLSTGYMIPDESCNRVCTSCPCEQTKCRTCNCTSECSACSNCTKKQTKNIMEIVQDSDEVVISINLKKQSNNTEEEEWHEALNIVRYWGKELGKTLKEKTPHIQFDVKISGHSCYQGSGNIE